MCKEPKVLTRMRLSCCWGDSLDEKELNEIVDYIENLEQQCKKQKEVIDKIYELIKQHIRKDEFLELNEWQTRDLLDLLKEVSK